MSLRALADEVLLRAGREQTSRRPAPTGVEQGAEQGVPEGRRKPHVPRSTPKGLEQRNTEVEIRLGPDWSDDQAVRDWFEERLAIIEEGCDLPKDDAVQQAYECLVIEWLNQAAPVQKDPTWCSGCGEPMEVTEATPVPDGRGGHYWLHQDCWNEWMRKRRALAEEALRGKDLVRAEA